MRVTNWLVGIVGVVSLTMALYVHFSKRDVIRMTQGTLYYREATKGYGILAAVKPSKYDPAFHVPTYEFILFDGSIDNANNFFSPLVIEADEDSALVHIDSPKGREVAVSVYHTRKESELSYVRISRSLDDRMVTYADTDGDFLPDRRITNYRGKGEKLEDISYTFKEVEQAGTEQPATRSQSDSEGGYKPQPESEGRSR
jgi:hypothetical protein